MAGMTVVIGQTKVSRLPAIHACIDYGHAMFLYQIVTIPILQYSAGIQTNYGTIKVQVQYRIIFGVSV